MLGYDSIGKQLVARNKLSELPRRERVNLLNALLDDLGITARLIEEDDKVFERIWQEQIALIWNK